MCTFILWILTSSLKMLNNSLAQSEVWAWLWTVELTLRGLRYALLHCTELRSFLIVPAKLNNSPQETRTTGKKKKKDYAVGLDEADVHFGCDFESVSFSGSFRCIFERWRTNNRKLNACLGPWTWDDLLTGMFWSQCSMCTSWLCSAYYSVLFVDRYHF